MGKLMRKLAVAALVACVAVCAIAPGAAFAASKITLKSGGAAPSTVYAGHRYDLKVSGQKAKFYSSNKSIATVGVTTGRLKAVASGTVKITAKSAKTGKVVASKTFTVRQRAESITASPDVIYLGSPGDTATISAELNPSTSTDVVRFYTDDKSIATVGMTSGKVTAVGNGTCIIKVYAKATKATSNSSKSNKLCTVEVRVGPRLATAEHDGVRIFATLTGAPSSLQPSDFVLTQSDTQAACAVKSVELDGDQVVLETESRLVEGCSYTLAFGSSSVSFDAVSPEVGSVELTPDTIVSGLETPVKMRLFTAKGSLIAESNLSGSGLSSGYTASLKLDSADGFYYASAGTLCLWEPGKVATVEVVKHTGTFEDGVEVGNSTWTATVTAREPREGEAVPTYDASSVSYSYSGSVGGTISITLSDNVPPILSAGDFTVKLKPDGGTGRAEYVPDAASVSGKSITLTISSSDLTNGRTYEVYCTKAPIAKKLGEFTVVKYIYVDSGDDEEEDPTEEPSNPDSADSLEEVTEVVPEEEVVEKEVLVEGAQS